MDSRSGADKPVSVGQMLSRLDVVDDDLTVYILSGTAVAPETPIELVDEEVQCAEEGMSYLLEVSIIKDVMRVWKLWRGGAEPSIPQACDAIAYYALHDAYQPVTHWFPDERR